MFLLFVDRLKNMLEEILSVNSCFYAFLIPYKKLGCPKYYGKLIFFDHNKVSERFLLI